MDEAPGTAPVDWRPYQATGIVLGAALAMNLVTKNGLWFWYTTVGTSAFLIVVGLVRAYRWPVPSGAVWTVGVTAGLHYVGGSLSGIHAIGGVNGLYFAFPWWDNVVHFLGCAALSVAAFAVLESLLPQARRGLLAFLAVSVSSFAGVLAELYEFAQFVFLGTVDQGYYTNTLLDLYYNLLGATAATIVYARLSRLAPAVPAAPATPDPPAKALADHERT